MDSFLDKEIPPNLKSARKDIEDFRQIKIVTDFYWLVNKACWVQEIEVSISKTNNRNVPLKTNWFVACTDDYPFGSIYVFPSRDKGVKYNFAHQDYIDNCDDESSLWLNGHLCLTGEHIAAERREPRTLDRLKWIYERLISWVETAANNLLLAHGHRYELPAVKKSEADGPFVLTREDAASYELIENSNEDRGYILGSEFYLSKRTLVVTKLISPKFDEVVTYQWNEKFKFSKSEMGIWIKLKECPIVEEWHTPRTFKELYVVLEKQGISLKEIVKKSFGRINLKEEFIIGLLFPISRLVGGSEERHHWYFFRMPALYNKKLKISKDESQKNIAMKTIESLSLSHSKIEWFSTRNVDDERLFSRGSFSASLKDKVILIIGAGALGSIVTELLAKSGCRNLSIVDYDVLDVGNVARHTLGIDSLFVSKSISIAKKIQRSNFHASIRGISTTAQSLSDDQLSEFDLIIDTTGDDDILSFFEFIKKKDNLLLLSLSLGYEAKKMYFHLSSNWSTDNFFNYFSSHIKDDNEQIRKNAPSEGVGCWHFAFPARIDEIWGLASIAISTLNNLISKNVNESTVLYKNEQNQDGINEIKATRYK